MIILGIDPGSRRLGWGAICEEAGRPRLVDLGTVRTDGTAAMPQRLAAIHAEVSALLDRHGPDRVAIETVFHGVNVRSLITLGQARGAVMAAVGTRDVTVCEYSPAEIKRAVTGQGNAAKEQVARMVWSLLGPGAREQAADGGSVTLDATDALAVAITALHRLR